MNNNINKKKSDKLAIPNFIIKESYKMKFKTTLSNNNFSYRCIHRTCEILLTIWKDVVKKLTNKEANLKINYSINKEYSCLITKINKEIIINKEWITDIEIRNIIKLNKKKIENILYKVRAEKYPTDDDILKFIQNIIITFDKNNEEFEELPFFFLEIINL